MPEPAMSPKPLLLGLCLLAGGALAQPAPMHGHALGAAPSSPGALPTLPGQDAFAALQEIVRLLEADPATDWTRVDLDALRLHLVDMAEVMLRAETTTRRIEGGVEVTVTGQGRTLAALRRMVPAHARELDGMPGWRAGSEVLPDGVRLTVTSADPKQVVHIRGLGFFGLMASGAHHQAHHLAIARGAHLH
jgi:antitoxin (DNA-binding transcriptional repressor) of toxin-antitoxin stability system